MKARINMYSFKTNHTPTCTCVNTRVNIYTPPRFSVVTGLSTSHSNIEHVIEMVEEQMID